MADWDMISDYCLNQSDFPHLIIFPLMVLQCFTPIGVQEILIWPIGYCHSPYMTHLTHVVYILEWAGCEKMMIFDGACI